MSGVPGPKGSLGDAIFVWLVAILVGLAISAGIHGTAPRPSKDEPTQKSSIVVLR